MRRTWQWVLAGAALTAGLTAGVGVAVAGGTGDGEAPIAGAALDRASAAALASTGGGRVTETEVGDEDAYYEVEVTLPDGRVVDVAVDEGFTVVGSGTDGPETGPETGPER